MEHTVRNKSAKFAPPKNTIWNFLVAGIAATAILISPTITLVNHTLEHLYVEHTYLFDIGYWIGLSTQFNPLLIEPSSILPNYSYFNTHFSPAFIGLQLSYIVLGTNNPPLFFAYWFCFLGLLPVFIATSATLHNLFSTTKSNLYRKIAIFCAVNLIMLIYINSNIWQNSFINYLHTEAIGMQLIGAGWLLLAFEETNIEDNETVTKTSRKWKKLLGLTLISFGALFHELISIFAILSLLSVILFKSTEKKGKPFNLARDPAIYIFASIVIWALLKSLNFFPGSSQAESALQRIYLGTPIFTHLSVEYYLNNLMSLIHINLVAISFLVFSLIISLISRKNLYKIFLLPIIALTAYIILSPLAYHQEAAILRSHYNYPLALCVFFALFSLSFLKSLSIQKKLDRRVVTLVLGLAIITVAINISSKSLSTGKVYIYADMGLNKLKTFPILQKKLNNKITFIESIKRIHELNLISKASNLKINKMAENRSNKFSLLKLKWGEESQSNNIKRDTVFMVDHSLAALYPNLIGYCNLVAPYRSDCLHELIKAGKGNSLALISMQPQDSLDVKLIKEYIQFFKLHVTSRELIGSYLNQDYQITIFHEDS